MWIYAEFFPRFAYARRDEKLYCFCMSVNNRHFERDVQ